MTEERDSDYILGDQVARGVEWRPNRRVFATFFSEHEVKSNWAKVIDIKGGEAAVIFEKGRVKEIVTRERRRAGGLFSQFKTAIGLPSGLSFLLLDTTRIELEILFGDPERILSGPGKDDWYSLMRGPLITKDQLQLSARVTAWVRLRLEDLLQQPDRVDHLLGLMKGERHLTHEQIADLLVDSGVGQTLQEVTYKTEGAAFRANPMLDDEVVTQCRATVLERMQYLGFWLEELRIVWGVTASEYAGIHQQETIADERVKDIDNQRELAEIRREGDRDLEHEQQGQRADDIRQDFRRGQQLADATTDSQTRGLAEAQRLQFKAQEDVLNVRLLSAEAEVGMKTLEHMKRLKMEREQLERQHQQTVIQGNNQMAMAMLQAAASGNVDADALKMIMGNSTLANAAAQGSEQAQAVADAVGGQRQLDAHRAGMADALGQQNAMLQGSAALAQGLNRNPMMGFGLPAAPIAMQAQAPVAGLLGQAALTCGHCQAPVQAGWKLCPACGQSAMAAPAGPTCPHCQGDVQDGWKACPGCGNSLDAPSCPTCNGPVQAGWKACPGCGGSLEAGPLLCPSCQAEVQSSWKACPGCGGGL